VSTSIANVALVTGVGGGIGAAIASHLASHHYTVYGTSRSVEVSRADPRSGVNLRALDVRDEQATAAAVAEVIGATGRIDVLVNNAGVALAGALEETSIAEAKELFETNFFGALRTTTAVLPHMRSARRGRIIFVSSVLGFLPAPFMGIYAASKHAIEAYAETLDHEVRAFGIRSILVEPSFTATRLVKHQRTTAQRIPAYDVVRDRVLQRFAENTERGARPEEVAEVVFEAASAESPDLRYPVAGAAKSLSWLRRFVPSRMFERSFRHRALLDI
jgi:NAD(P)-dependent dehydrogenase (short-subunit alcohol dehydrogenase family)